MCVGRFRSELVVAKQRSRHLLHPYRRSWSVDGRRRVRVLVQVAFRRFPTASRRTSVILMAHTSLPAERFISSLLSLLSFSCFYATPLGSFSVIFYIFIYFFKTPFIHVHVFNTSMDNAVIRNLLIIFRICEDSLVLGKRSGKDLLHCRVLFL